MTLYIIIVFLAMKGKLIPLKDTVKFKETIHYDQKRIECDTSFLTV